MPGSRALIMLASALGVPVSYLLNNMDVDIRVEFRRNDPADTTQDELYKIHIEHLLENYLSLEDVLGISSAQWDKPPGIPCVVHGISDAERAAARLRRHWNLGTGPIPHVTGLLEDHGIKVLLMGVGNVDGAAVTASRPEGRMCLRLQSTAMSGVRCNGLRLVTSSDTYSWRVLQIPSGPRTVLLGRF